MTRHNLSLTGSKLLAASFSIILLIIPLLSSSAIRSAAGGTSKTKTDKPASVAPGVSQSEAEKAKADKKVKTPSDFLIAAPYWSIEDGFVSTIEMKNYRVDTPLTVTPVLYPRHGREIALNPITLAASETRVININKELGKRGNGNSTGSAEIRYNYPTEGVFGANLTVLNEARSLIYNFQFNMPDQTSRLEGLWWFQDQNTDGFVAAQNASAKAITVRPTLYVKDQAYKLNTLRLQPHEMQLISLRKGELRKLGLETATGGGIRLDSSALGALVAGGGLVNPKTGFSAPLRVQDPQMLAMNVKHLGQTLHAINVPIGRDMPDMGMGLPPGSLMNPIMNLRNVTDQWITVRPVFKYEMGGALQSFYLPEMQLKPQQGERVELLPFWKSGQIPEMVSWGSLEIGYTGRPGSLIATVTSVDQTGTFVFDARIDNRLAAGFEGEYWSVERDNDTAITVKNITDRDAKCSISLQYDRGRKTYEMQPFTLRAGEARMLDVKHLQMEGVLDVKGKLLPKTATFGGLTLTEEPGGRHFLIDTVVFNPKTATCGVCGFGCLYPSALNFAGAVYITALVYRGNFLPVSARMCNGTTQTGWECTCDFSSDNTLIATVDPSCQAAGTGVNGGRTTFRLIAVDVPGPHCGDQTLYASCPVLVQVPTRLARFNYTATSPGAPNGYGPLIDTATTNNEVRNVTNGVEKTNQCGAYRNLVYELLDQEGNPITLPYTITETFSGYTGPVSTPPDLTRNISANGLVQDLMYFGKTLPACLGPDEHETMTQKFRVKIGTAPAVNLTTTNLIERGKYSGVYKVEVSITTP